MATPSYLILSLLDQILEFGGLFVMMQVASVLRCISPLVDIECHLSLIYLRDRTSWHNLDGLIRPVPKVRKQMRCQAYIVHQNLRFTALRTADLRHSLSNLCPSALPRNTARCLRVPDCSLFGVGCRLIGDRTSFSDDHGHNLCSAIVYRWILYDDILGVQAVAFTYL
jgi:hypothetical protein